MNRMAWLLLTAALAFSALPDIAHAETAFTYQGRLSAAGTAAQGSYDFQFRLFDAENAGTAVGSLQSASAVVVSGGVFSVLLDFGDGPFNSAPRWLEIKVREAGGASYTTLAPRQRIGASPFAIETMFVAPGAVDTAALQDDAVTRAKLADNSVGTFQIENNTVTSTDIRDGTIATADIGPGIYRSKADLYQVSGPGMTLLTNPQSETVGCFDPNDLPISGGCRVGLSAAYVATSVTDNHWTSTTDAASVTCNGINVHPSNPSLNPVPLQAYIICVSVPGP
ncbi:MAG: hypothetical protein KDI56_13920 [Xanthomonadales bacterium]|nr:hypothetical protein [Xanthomonadales bacterium]